MGSEPPMNIRPRRIKVAHAFCLFLGILYAIPGIVLIITTTMIVPSNGATEGGSPSALSGILIGLYLTLAGSCGILGFFLRRKAMGKIFTFIFSANLVINSLFIPWIYFPGPGGTLIKLVILFLAAVGLWIAITIHLNPVGKES